MENLLSHESVEVQGKSIMKDISIIYCCISSHFKSNGLNQFIFPKDLVGQEFEQALAQWFFCSMWCQLKSLGRVYLVVGLDWIAQQDSHMPGILVLLHVSSIYLYD